VKGDLDHLSSRSWITINLKDSAENLLVWSSRQKLVKTTYVIRHLVEKALHLRKLTPDIENEINYELTRMGHISDVDYEALELLMSEMDAGRIQLVPTP
jgi:hypothetical protein